jgi:succinate dehydrogenase / fumarate reductase membrane anchor subunit
MKGATGSSHSGTGSWLVQRATAVVLALALPGLTICLLAAWPTDFAGWQALFAPRWSQVLIMLTGAALALHAWVGMRDIFMDYIHPVRLRLALYLAVIATLAGSMVWLAAILFGTPGSTP